jgi:hypothetical protein
VTLAELRHDARWLLAVLLVVAAIVAASELLT